jgi:hypothetical protein
MQGNSSVIDGEEADEETALFREREVERRREELDRMHAASDLDDSSFATPDSLLSLYLSLGEGKAETHGFPTPLVLRQLSEHDVGSISRWSHQRKMAFLLGLLLGECRRMFGQFETLQGELEEVSEVTSFSRAAEDGFLLSGAAVIGATVIGALLHLDAIGAAKPIALIIEEAAEVPEACLLALLALPSLRRCIMVGDHQQLKPSVQAYELAQRKHLDTSAFERLTLLGVPTPVLRFQSRMIPAVLGPVLQHYPMLESNEKRVADLTLPAWLVKPLYW